MKVKRFVTLLVYLAMILSNLVGPVARVQPVRAAATRTDALVLVNSTSANYADFQHFIQPYLDYLGVPYTLVDIASGTITAGVGDYALILIGHRQLDTGDTYLDAAEEGYITAAVNAGTGLVNFDNDLSVSGVGRYSFVDTIFGFGYTTPPTLANVTFATGAGHYITARHAANETITTGDMTLAGITLPAGGTLLAQAGTGGEPFLAATGYGQGRAVQWGSYEWMSHAVKGPLMGFDDLIWRSLVWAARKPFVMQGLPPFVTLRMDDTSGPLEWIHIASEYGFIPWAGVFIDDIDSTEAADLSGLTNSGKATAAVHAFNTSDFFYFDHANGVDFSDATIAAHFAAGTAWHTSNNIPVSKYLVGHFYELGTNVFEELQSWGVEYVGTMMDPGQLEISAPWMMKGPFRLYETGSAYDRNRGVHYADFFNIPNHAELDGEFFNCITEIRDLTGYEWHPSPDIQLSIDQGTEWLTRPLDGMELATLFTHEYDLDDINMDMWRQIMAGITQNIAGYGPIFVSMDYACQYLRSTVTSNISASQYDTASRQITTSFSGSTDLLTKFYVFTEEAGQIQGTRVDVPAFTGSTQVSYTLPGGLNHITVSPNPATVVAGATQQFTAQGYDAENNPIPNLTFTWSVVNGGGTIDSQGLFTAGASVGSYPDTIQAQIDGINGYATVNVSATTIDHFTFDPIASPRYKDMAFVVTIRARDVNNNPVVSYTGTANLSDSTGTLQPGTTGAFVDGVWTGAVTIASLASGVTITAADGSGHSGTSDDFDVITVQCPCTIWNDSATPQQAAVNDGRPIEVGFRFRSDLDGYITGLRFYKGSLNTGTHIGHLWSADGTLLAEATFTDETVSGWQVVSLGTPVAITADTTYLASYYSESGYFAYNSDDFLTAVVNPPLKALANGEDGPNGVYRYDTSGFPNQHSPAHSPNYWVDIVFDTTLAADTTPPSVTSVIPVNGAAGVAVGSTVSASFSEALDPATLSNMTFELRDASDAVVAAVVSYNTSIYKATLDPVGDLNYSTHYTARLAGGASGVKDQAGNPLAADYTWSFTTGAPPVPPSDDGPGGPILVISSAANPFSRYYAEILRAEGLNAFLATDISKVTSELLVDYDIVLLGEMTLTTGQATLLTDWVNGGGNLIAMRPDAQLAGLLGLAPAGGSLSNAYLLIDTGQAPGQGLVGQTIQFHGTADLYTLNGATSLATLYASAATATAYPAATLRSVGSNGGQAAAFTFDLARSVVYTHQGNPSWAGQERDGIGPIRPDDMFYGDAAGDPQADWIDLDKVAIPQADEQQRLLANLIGVMNLDKMPLPRFWYFPRGEKAVVLMTSDDHAVADPTLRMNQLLAASPTDCSVDDWECVRSSVYLYPYSQISDAQAANYQALGFELGLHVNTNCSNYTLASLGTFYSDQFAAWETSFPSLAAPDSERTHCIVWSDWISQPQVERQHNIRLDTNYYFWPPSWVQDRPGFFTGSGLPMRFADLDGTIVDVYQAPTQMTDESAQSYPYTIDALIDRALGPEGYYGVFTANMHSDYTYSPGSEAIIASAQAQGVPVVSGRQLLAWLDGRNGSSFEDLAWDGDALSFSVALGAGANGLQVLLPVQSSAGDLTGLTLGGSPVAYATTTIKGVEYATFLAGAGVYSASYAVDATPPVISGVTTGATSEGEVAITWTTNEAADSRVDYGTDPGNQGYSVTDPAKVSAHSLTLTGLLPNTTYYYRVTSTDAEGNSASYPSGSPASFTTPTENHTDTTVSDFSAGTPDGNTVVSQMGDGEVILEPTVWAEFSGIVLPAGWSSTPWTGGAATVSSGSMSVDGTLAATDDFYPAGRSIEFVAAFGAEAYQHGGFGQYLAETSEAWAMFSTLSTNDSLYARTNNNGAMTNSLIAGNWIGSPHRYRIEWNADSVVFYIDGDLVHSENVAIAASMRPVFSDYSLGGAAISVDWVHMSHYPGAGTFTSRVIDAGSPVSWTSLVWTADLPVGTGVAMSVRTGNTPTPDGSWTAFTPVSNGGALSSTSRYIEYQAALTTANIDLTPVLKDVSIFYVPAQINLPPVAVDDVMTAQEDTPLTLPASGTGSPAANDSDPEGDPLAVTEVSGATGGTVALAGATLIFTPAANLCGTGAGGFDYSVSDGQGGADSGHVTLDITCLNDAPVANAQSISTEHDVAKAITLSGSDVDGDVLAYAVVTPPAHGALSGAAPDLTYTPDGGYVGADNFTFTVNDGTATSAPATVSIAVTSSTVPPLPSSFYGEAHILDNPPVAGSLVEVTIPGVAGAAASTTLVANGADLIYTLDVPGDLLDTTPKEGGIEGDSITFKIGGRVVAVAAWHGGTNARLDFHPPQALPGGPYSGFEGTAISFNGSANDWGSDALTYQWDWGNDGVYDTTGQAPSHTWTAAGAYTVALKVTDAQGGEGTATVTVTVSNVAPVLAPIGDKNVAELATLSFTASATDSDPLSFSLVDAPAGALIDPASGVFTWTPTEAQGPGAYTFDVCVSDGDASDCETITVTVSEANAAPVAQDQPATTAEDSALAGQLVATDSDQPAVPLTYAKVSDPVHGTLALNSDGSFTYTPAANYHGPDSFTFKANDGTVDSNTATVSITVVPVNDAPVAEVQLVTTDEDMAKAILLTGSDVDGDPLAFAIVTGPIHGLLSGPAPNLTYTPVGNFSGSDSFTFKINDGTVDSNTATVAITILPVNDAPVATAQAVTTEEDTPKAITLSGYDPENSALTFTVATGPSHGSLSGDTPDLTYTPDLSYNGPDSFTFTASDGELTSPPATIAITVTPVNDVPVCTAPNLDTTEDTPAKAALPCTDADGDALTLVIVAAPQHGVLALVGGDLVYTPDADFFGEDSFSFAFSDGTTQSNTIAVTVTVAAANDAPVAVNQAVTTEEETAKVLTLAATDVDGDTLTYTLITQPTHGLVTGAAPNLTYTPALNYHGPDSFTFKANDGAADSSPATVTITVTPVNDAPVAAAQAVTTDEDTAKAITLAATDADGDALTYTVVTPPANGTLTGTAPDLNYSPAANYHGPDSFTFQASDGIADSNTATVTITVMPVNDAPVCTAPSLDTTEDTPAQAPLPCTDADGDALTLVIVVAPGHGALALVGEDLTYTPEADFFGEDGFSFAFSDGTTQSNTIAVTVTVSAASDAPVLDPIGDKTIVELSTLSFNAAASDVDNDPLTFSLAGGSAGAVPAGASISPSGAFSWTPTVDQGPNTYTFDVCASDGALSDCETITVAVLDSTVTHSLALAPGWNLVSFNVHPTDTAIAAVLANIAGNYNLVYAWDATGGHASDGNWLKYAPGTPPYSNSLHNLDEKLGFWIFMLEADTLEVTGTAPVTTSISLSTQAGGWNLVGYPSATGRPLPDALRDHGVGTDTNLVYAYHANDLADPWKLYDKAAPVWANDLTTLTPGWGYWIYVSADHTWTVDYSAP